MERRRLLSMVPHREQGKLTLQDHRRFLMSARVMVAACKELPAAVQATNPEPLPYVAVREPRPTHFD